MAPGLQVQPRKQPWQMAYSSHAKLSQGLHVGLTSSEHPRPSEVQQALSVQLSPAGRPPGGKMHSPGSGTPAAVDLMSGCTIASSTLESPSPLGGEATSQWPSSIDPDRMQSYGGQHAPLVSMSQLSPWCLHGAGGEPAQHTALQHVVIGAESAMHPETHVSAVRLAAA